MHKTQEKYYKHLGKFVGKNGVNVLCVLEFISIVFNQMDSAVWTLMLSLKVADTVSFSDRSGEQR